MHFTPGDQILLLAGLHGDAARRSRIWAHPALARNRARLGDAGLVVDGRLSDPAGIAAARSLRHISLDDLIAEHLGGEDAV